MSVHVYVDESEPYGSSVYLLAAAVIASDQCVPTRDAIRPLGPGGQRKLRSHDESAARRMLITKTIATLPARYIVVSHTKTGERSERCRRLCLRWLLCELDMAGVAQVILEQRQRRQDAADMRLMSDLRTAQVIGSGLRMEHAAGIDEPLLWLPDSVASATGAARRGETRYLDQLAGLVRIVEA